MDQSHPRTWSVSWYDKAMYQIIKRISVSREIKKCGKLIIRNLFLSPRAITLWKINRSKPNSNLICWYYKAMYQISNEYFKAWTKKVRKTYLPDWQTDRRTECKPKVPFNFLGRRLNWQEGRYKTDRFYAPALLFINVHYYLPSWYIHVGTCIWMTHS
jgi:hypothetical protein